MKEKEAETIMPRPSKHRPTIPGRVGGLILTTMTTATQQLTMMMTTATQQPIIGLEGLEVKAEWMWSRR